MTNRARSRSCQARSRTSAPAVAGGLTIRERRQLDAAAAPPLAPVAVAAIQMSGCRVIATKHRTRGLVHRDGTTHTSPPQTEEQARSLIVLLAGSTAAAGGARPCRQPVAGGQRLIEVERRL